MIMVDHPLAAPARIGCVAYRAAAALAGK